MKSDKEIIDTFCVLIHEKLQDINEEVLLRKEQNEANSLPQRLIRKFWSKEKDSMIDHFRTN
jgi:hypothetical protein